MNATLSSCQAALSCKEAWLIMDQCINGSNGKLNEVKMDPSSDCNSFALRENTMHFCKIFFFCFSVCCSVNCMRRKSNIVVLSCGMMTHWICWIVKAHLIKWSNHWLKQVGVDPLHAWSRIIVCATECGLPLTRFKGFQQNFWPPSIFYISKHKTSVASWPSNHELARNKQSRGGQAGPIHASIKNLESFHRSQQQRHDVRSHLDGLLSSYSQANLGSSASKKRHFPQSHLRLKTLIDWYLHERILGDWQIPWNLGLSQ